MKKVNTIATLVITLIGVFVTLPIWLYIVHTLLSAAHVDRLVWFLFWVYLILEFGKGVTWSLLTQYNQREQALKELENLD